MDVVGKDSWKNRRKVFCLKILFKVFFIHGRPFSKKLVCSKLSNFTIFPTTLLNFR